MATSTTVLFAIVFASFVAYSYQLQCYECSTIDVSKIKGFPKVPKDANAACGNFSDTALVTCPTSAKVCWKLDVDAGDAGTASTYSCGTSAEDCDKIDDVDVPGVTTSCYSCDTDKCNSASGIFAASSLLALSLIAAVLY